MESQKRSVLNENRRILMLRVSKPVFMSLHVVLHIKVVRI